MLGAGIRTARVLAIISVISIGMAQAQPDSGYLDVAFKLASPITLHEPVIIYVTIQNIVSYGISIDLGWKDTAAFLFHVSTPDGKHVDMPSQDPRSGILVMGGVAKYLEPGEEFSERIILTEWHPFDISGEYQIAAKLAVPVTVGKPIKPWISEEDSVRENVAESTLNLRILPRDATALKNRCEDLISRLHVARRFDKSSPIAEEISYITDPIAIPYLIKLVNEREEYFAIEGLKRIATDEAWEAMIEVTKSEYDPGSAEYAKAVLKSRVSQIHNPEIRKKVEAAIRDN